MDKRLLEKQNTDTILGIIPEILNYKKKGNFTLEKSGMYTRLTKRSNQTLTVMRQGKM